LNHLHAAVLCLVLCVLPGFVSARYAFPVEDPFLATVLGTPSSVRAPVSPESVAEERSIQLFADREIPRVFWQQGRFRYSVARQQGAAPLIFLIAGTGARYDSAKLRYLQAVFHQAGFHVVNLTSPTHTDFIVTGSMRSVPGRMQEDVLDLYEAMDRISVELREGLLVTEFHLAGYSLGGSQSAFLAELDSRLQVFRFKRVLMLNPSVNLFTSVNILDQMLRDAVPGGAPDLKRVFDDVFRRVANYFHRYGRDPIDSELLYKIAEVESISRAELSTMIAVSFRISSANMLFTSDVMTGAHHVVQPGAKLGVTTPLLPYLRVAGRWTWLNYLDDVLLPFWRQDDPDLTRESLIASGSLRSIEDFLRGATHIGVMHNRDDLILGPGDLAWLERTFGDRAIVYPTGGHCGNLMYHENIADTLAFFGVGSGSGE
jgi:pimeloyl-ACP methyl ester carboxylesterase